MILIMILNLQPAKLLLISNSGIFRILMVCSMFQTPPTFNNVLYEVDSCFIQLGSASRVTQRTNHNELCYILLNSWVLLLIRSYFIKYLVVGYFLFQIFINHVLFINKNQICQDITLLNLEIINCFDCVKPPY